MEIEHYVLTADSHDGLPCTVLLLLRLRLFSGELANSTIQVGPVIIIGDALALGSSYSYLALSVKF